MPNNQLAKASKILRLVKFYWLYFFIQTLKQLFERLNIL